MASLVDKAVGNVTMSLRLLSIKNASITTKSQKKNVVKKEDRLDDSRGSSSTETSTTSELTSGPKIDVVSTPKSRGITAGSKADRIARNSAKVLVTSTSKKTVLVKGSRVKIVHSNISVNSSDKTTETITTTKNMTDPAKCTSTSDVTDHRKALSVHSNDKAIEITRKKSRNMIVLVRVSNTGVRTVDREPHSNSDKTTATDLTNRRRSTTTNLATFKKRNILKEIVLNKDRRGSNPTKETKSALNDEKSVKSEDSVRLSWNAKTDSKLVLSVVVLKINRSSVRKDRDKGLQRRRRRVVKPDRDPERGR